MSRELEKAADRELSRHRHVKVEREQRGHHKMLRLHANGQSRCITYSGSASDGRAAKNHVGDIRRALRAMGAIAIA